MATEMQRLIGASQEDFDEEDMETDVKDEADGEEDEDGEKNADANSMMVGVDGGMGTSSSNNNHLFQQQDQEVGTPGGGGGGGGARRCRPLEEKERTKLRERQRRAITAKILAGLRRHGNYNLRVRADINDVIAALAREAGWVVLPDGTAYPANSQGLRPGVSSVPVTSSSSQMVSQPHISLEGVASGNQNSTEQNAGNIKNAFMPGSSPCDVSSINPEDGENQSKSHPHIGGSIDKVGEMQIVGIPQKFAERDFSNTAYVPVYVMLPLGVINMKCELVDPDGLSKQLRILKSVNADGVMVDCWWGIVEGHAPLEYKWFGYRRLFEMVRDLKLKLQVVMSFHECGGNLDDDVCITLPHWVAEIGRSNPDIYFTDRAGRRNPECLSWGIDKERVLRGRTALEVYFDCMRSFRVEFEEFFQDGIISMIQVGLGPCGELRFPSCTIKHGWRYPGIGEFQCYDLYLLKSLRKAAEVRGHSFWGRGPDNAGSYNSRPHESGFFCDGGDYDGYYGRFFLDWYSRVLVDHGDRVLSLAKLAFDGTCIAAKLSCIHWWYKTPSHAAELTAGFYNPCNRDGYAAIVAMLKKHGASLHLVCTQFQMLDQQINIQESMGDPQGLFWQVLNAAWDVCIPVSSENAVLCHDRVGYNKILDNSKPLTDPDGRHLSSFTYLRLSSPLMESHNLVEFDRFAKKMHGEAVHDDSHPFMYSK